ncbi:hypothetical protein LDENG_00257410 [Lucifuga dentata]|nr:hypothetical protein LDENG_00257410 [Lucifuga dentata]
MCQQFSCSSIYSPLHQKAKRKPPKISSAQAAKHLKVSLQEGASVTTFLETTGARQPFLLCTGEQKNKIQRFFIVVDQKLIPCKAQTSVTAFDELFKAHYVFSVSYDETLCSFYTFVQTTVYNIDARSTKEIRARLLQRDS